jgi:hypothetical protein
LSRSKRQKAARAAKKAKKKQQKEKSMFGFNWGEKNKSGGILGSKPQVPKILAAKKDNLNIVLFRQSTLDKIGEICTPTAGSSEFQVHYRALQIILTDKNTSRRVVFTIPTVFFNMPQKVTSVSVKFEFDEVAEMSDKVSELSQTMAQSFTKAFPTQYFKSKGFEVEAREAEIGSIHRHPGRSGFSSTDLNNATENPGIIFRTLEAEDRIQVDSVIYVNGGVDLVVTESRLINVKEDGNEGIEGTYERIPTMSYIIEDRAPVDDFAYFFGEDPVSENFKFKVDKDLIFKEYENIEAFLNSFLKEEDYEPVLIIDPNLITQEYTYHHRYNTDRYSRYSGRSASYQSDDDWDDISIEYDVSDDGYEYIPYSKDDDTDEKVVAQEGTFRPTWRKVQALGELTKFGIDVNNSSIDGTASVRDVKTIMAAFNNKKVDIPDRLTFFKKAAYPADSIKRAGYDPVTLKKL